MYRRDPSSPCSQIAPLYRAFPELPLLLQAILLVQQNKASAAVKLLEPLFQHVEPMQEHVAVRVCVLLTELYLTTHSFNQAASKHLLPCVLWTLLPCRTAKSANRGFGSQLYCSCSVTQVEGVAVNLLPSHCAPPPCPPPPPPPLPPPLFSPSLWQTALA